MSAIAIVSLLVGAVLGRSLRVLVLVPAIAAGMIAVIAGACATGASLSATLWAGIAVALGLQFGYAGGVLLKHVLAAARAPRIRTGTTAVARSRS
jgi:hypothetical protein